MKVYKFKFFYDFDGFSQDRYVVAETEEAASEKLSAYFEEMAANGYAKPVCIMAPVVEIDSVLI